MPAGAMISCASGYASTSRVRLVEAEDVGPRDPVAVHELLELVVAADHPVDVVPEMRVRVEDRRTRGQLVPQLGFEPVEKLLRALERLGHPRNLPAAAYSNA